MLFWITDLGWRDIIEENIWLLLDLTLNACADLLIHLKGAIISGECILWWWRKEGDGVLEHVYSSTRGAQLHVKLWSTWFVKYT